MFKNLQFTNRTTIYLICILLVAILIRIVGITNVPNGFFVDEASKGYDAYSLYHTLRDRYGAFLPLFLRSFDDYREAVYAYLVIPSINIFGLNEFAVRLPSAIIGSCTVLVIYFLGKELFNKNVGLIAALFLAISPWHIHFSRTSFRVILLPFLLCLGLLFFLKSFRNSKYIIASGSIFALSLYTYTSARFFVSLFILGLLILFWRHFWENRGKVLITLVIFMTIFIPLFMFWVSPEGMSRASQVGFQLSFDKLIPNYLSYFSPNFLFYNDGTLTTRQSPPYLGQLYYLEFFTVILGLVFLFKEANKTTRNIIILWLLLYPLPGAFLEAHHSIRSFVGSTLFAILSAYGTTKIVKFLPPRLKNKTSLLVAALLFFVTINFLILTKLYFIDYRLNITRDWQYGMREAITYAQKSPYEYIIMKRKGDWVFEDRSYGVLVAFYTQYDPKKFQEITTHPWNRKTQDPDYSIGKFTLMSITKDSKLPDKFLLIVYPDEKPILGVPGYQEKEVHVVKDERGMEHFKIYEVTKTN